MFKSIQKSTLLSLNKKKRIRAAFGHDALCELVAAGLLDSSHMPEINDLFEIWCVEDGVNEKIAGGFRTGLKAFWKWNPFRPYK